MAYELDLPKPGLNPTAYKTGPGNLGMPSSMPGGVGGIEEGPGMGEKALTGTISGITSGLAVADGGAALGGIMAGTAGLGAGGAALAVAAPYLGVAVGVGMLAYSLFG